MNILITGGSGFLGWNATNGLRGLGSIVATYKKHELAANGCSFVPLDLTDTHSIDRVLRTAEPDVIVHTAALTEIAYCQSRQQEAYQVNVEGTERLVKMANRYNVRFIFISTDLVFGGTKSFYLESDVAHPRNYYAETKLLAEGIVKAFSPRYIILRTALMYGDGSQYHGCFTDWMSETLENHQPIPLFIDQYRTPLFVGDAVRAIKELIRHDISGEVFHVGGSERVNRYEFGKKFVEIFGYDSRLLIPKKMSEVEGFSIYGNDCSLNSDKIKSTFPGLALSTVEEGLKTMKSLRDNS
jgi:dTDP-4-dehydrorhamnose reductase